MIKEIIKLLSDDEKSLTTPLLKTQVFASRIGNVPLYEWVNKELNGFNYSDEIPEYRIAKASPIGTISDGYNYQQNTMLPVSIFGDKIAKELIKFKIDDGVKSLEDTSTGKYGDTIIKPMGADFCAMLTREAQKNGAEIQIIEGRIQVHIGEFVNSISKIRAKFLDLILKLEQQFPEIDEYSIDKNELNKSVTHIMTQINIHSSGEGNIITSGNHNTITANVNVTKGDISGLKDELIKNKVNIDDTNEIADIVAVESLENNQFGPNVKKWLSKMVNKSIEGSWEVGVAAAGGLLVELLKKYYGI
ncbi:hypothetical protein GS399_00630 [Pedobacter sp. HMF7647]|uniref:AbiTii domain-containing protein n=1 Tax=Hufsiella arboris TaxID=2695275 RepID=A0A7K1Y4X3_9SPHI|nr:hypothetical protein [Hufsiella arboris]MXV49460.1 hypothetical protein [Hufsiella arboris]